MSTEDFIPHLLAPEVLVRRAQILENLVESITSNLLEIDGDPPWVDLLRSWPMTIVGQTMMNSASLTKQQLTSLTSTHDRTNQLVLAAMEDAARGHRGTTWLPSAELADLASSKFPLLECPIITESNVAAAFEIAKWNVARTEQRAFALSVLYRLLKRHSNIPEAIATARGDILSYLHRRKMTFMRNLLLFGGLLGDDAASYAVVKAAEDCCWSPDGSTNWEVMSYLTIDNRELSSYNTADEKAFRADLDQLIAIRKM